MPETLPAEQQDSTETNNDDLVTSGAEYSQQNDSFIPEEQFAQREATNDYQGNDKEELIAKLQAKMEAHNNKNTDSDNNANPAEENKKQISQKQHPMLKVYGREILVMVQTSSLL